MCIQLSTVAPNVLLLSPSPFDVLCRSFFSPLLLNGSRSREYSSFGSVHHADVKWNGEEERTHRIYVAWSGCWTRRFRVKGKRTRYDLATCTQSALCLLTNRIRIFRPAFSVRSNGWRKWSYHPETKKNLLSVSHRPVGILDILSFSPHTESNVFVVTDVVSVVGPWCVWLPPLTVRERARQTSRYEIPLCDRDQKKTVGLISKDAVLYLADHTHTDNKLGTRDDANSQRSS